jgi:hypothetical protein
MELGLGKAPDKILCYPWLRFWMMGRANIGAERG